MSIKKSFIAILRMQQKDFTLFRPGGSSITIKVAPSNFFKTTQDVSEITVEGREFIILKDDLDAQTYGIVKRGDKLYHADLGTLTIDTTKEMYDLGGGVIAYRMRTA